jgi:hypothetical protein
MVLPRQQHLQALSDMPEAAGPLGWRRAGKPRRDPCSWFFARSANTEGPGP